MGGHHSPAAETTTWLTPRHILDPLGYFDLDPCAAPQNQTADRLVVLPEDGLAVDWFGRVWLNPPYGRETWDWLSRLADHGRGIALIFARTETVGFREQVWQRAHGVLFIYGRLRFIRGDGSIGKANAGAPSCLVAYSEEDAELLSLVALGDIPGHFVPLKKVG